MLHGAPRASLRHPVKDDLSAKWTCCGTELWCQDESLVPGRTYLGSSKEGYDR